MTSPEGNPAIDHDPARWKMLALLSTAELLGMSLWFAASAVAPQLARTWSLTRGQAAWLTTIVELGFIRGTAAAAVFNLADVMPSRWYFAVADIPTARIHFRPGSFRGTSCEQCSKRREWRLATGGYLGHMFELYARCVPNT
jgi:hypothetical protein